ncbi:MAG: hypothetical protein IPL79_11085 [Myxococcales bacterium]|nr:hypothetical protein [Myxococcales bacterium]
MQDSVVFAVVGVMVLVIASQWMLRGAFIKLSREQKIQMIETFEPKGRMRLVFVAVLALALIGGLTFAKKSAPFGISMVALIIAYYGFIIFSNVRHARDLGFPLAFRRSLAISGALRTGAIGAILALLISQLVARP